MDYLHSGIKILSGASECYSGVFHCGIVALQDGRRVQIGNVGSEGSGNPFHSSALFHDGSLGIEVVHVLGPALDGGVSESRILADKELNRTGMEVRNIVLGSGTAFDEMKVRTLFNDYECVLELARTLCVKSEI